MRHEGEEEELSVAGRAEAGGAGQLLEEEVVEEEPAVKGALAAVIIKGLA